MQLRTRLTIAFIGTTACLLLASFIIIYYNYSRQLEKEYYTSLQSKALMTAAMVVKNNSATGNNINDNVDLSTEFLPKKENIIIFDDEFVPIFSFFEEPSLSNNILQTIKSRGNYKFKIDMYDAIGIAYTTSAGRKLIIVAKSIFISEELVKLGQILIITFLLFLGIIAISGYYFVSKALAPITKMMHAMENMLPSDLSKRLKVDENKDEISRLSITFNQLLDRLEDTFKIQKAFLSNIAHEIRNPLASIISNIQIILTKDRQPNEYQKVLSSVKEEALDLQHVSSHLMELARIANKADNILFENIRLDEVLWQSIETVKKFSTKYLITVDEKRFPENSDKLRIYGNEVLLRTALVNLLENACKFSVNNTAIVSISDQQSNILCLSIKDFAPRISKEEIIEISKPFYRGQQTSKIKGSGIGLSLVSSIINIHNAQLIITAGNGEGNIFTLEFESIL